MLIYSAWQGLNFYDMEHVMMYHDKVQLTLAISNSLISNNRLSRSENLVPA